MLLILLYRSLFLGDLRRRGSVVFFEQFAEVVRVLIADSLGDFFDGPFFLLQQFLRMLQAHVDQVMDRAQSGRLLEDF